jgi:NAD-dependent dihydropyrimidine dehydrogenase PreA subunit
MAIGQAPDLEFLRDAKGLRFTPKGALEVDPFTLATGRTGVFAAGDVVTGSSSVAEAIGSGRRAAFSIDSYLRKEHLDQLKSVYVDSTGNIAFEKFPPGKREVVSQHVVKYEDLMNLEYFEKKRRIKKPSLPFSESIRTFEQIDKGFDKEEAKEEAGRCFHCGRCFACGMCIDICPGDILAMVDQQPQLAYPEECYHCGSCLIDCPSSAISFHIPLPLTLPTYPDRFFHKKEAL